MRFFLGGMAAALAALCAASAAHAAHGYFGYGYGTKAKGMGGAVLALPQDALQSAVNPAGGVYLGNRLDIGLGYFTVQARYKVTGAPSGAPGTFPLAPETVKAGRSNNWAPNIGYNRMIDPVSSFALAVYPNGGASTMYPASAAGGTGTFHAGETGINLKLFMAQASYARKVGPKTALGVGLPVAFQYVGAKGLSTFGAFVADGNPDNLTNRGTKLSSGVGLRLGVQSQVAPAVTVAASYQTKIRMKRYDAYSDLLAQRGRLDVPATGSLGVAYRPNPTSVVALDLQKIWYGDVPALANPFSNIGRFRTGEASYGLGGENGLGLGWRDVGVVKLGYETRVRPDTDVRAGISYGRQPIPSSEMFFNLVSPAVQEMHYTVGATRRMGNGGEWNIAAVYSPAKTVRGPNPLEAPGRQTIEIRQDEFGIEVSFGKAL